MISIIWEKYISLHKSITYDMKNKIEINEIMKYYDITADGQVFSKVRNKWLKIQQNSCYYLHVCISKGVTKPLWVFTHTLVALKYIGEPPTPKHEINHKDNNRANNHYTNLEWVTKSQNHLMAYKNGKDHYWLNKHRPSPSVATRMKMANAKNKRILFKFNGQDIIYSSIEQAASQLNTYRKRIYLCIRDHRQICGGYMSVIEDQRPD